MYISRHKKFDKHFAKLTKTQQQAFEKRLRLLIVDATHPQLNIHPLSGKYGGCKSMNITGDIRAIFEQPEADTIYFIAIGSHSELY